LKGFGLIFGRASKYLRVFTYSNKEEQDSHEGAKARKQFLILNF
jgi:hypothetical protein